MKSMRNKVFGFLFSLGIIFLFVTSCEVGMGSAVDTEPPELAISSPESASIIRGGFAIKGTWSDDQGVVKVSCLFTDTNNEKNQYKVDGTVETGLNRQGTWQVTVEGNSIPDGSYEASVSVFDAAGHETKANRQLVVDNTPPVIILKRPSSRKDEQDNNNIDGYGQLFTLKGLAADDSGVGLIEVSIYSDEGLTNLVKTISIKNVPNTISLDVAEFSEGVENDYSVIYGSTSRTAGERKRWCKVIGYDGAQYYPADGTEQSENDKKGNAATGYYLYEDLSSTVLNEFKITELYSMLNGSFSGERSASDSVLGILNDKKIDAGVFTLNPANNPFFTLSGYQELKKDGTDFGETMSVKNGNSLVISVKPGLDGYEIDGNSLSVYLRQCDIYGNPVGDPIQIDNITKEQSGTSYTITAPINKSEDIIIGKNYLVFVDGDDGHNPVRAKGNGYGFYFDSNGVKPTLKVTNPPSSAVVSYNDDTNSITLEGTVNFPSSTCEDGTVIIRDSTGNLTWNVAYINPSDGSNATVTQTSTASPNSLDTEVTWSKTLTFKKDNTADKETFNDNDDDNDEFYLPDGNHKFYIYAFTGNNFSTSGSVVYKEINIKVDTQKPQSPSLTSLNDAPLSQTLWYGSNTLVAQLTSTDPLRSGYASGVFKSEYAVLPITNTEAPSNWTSFSTTTSGYLNNLGEGTNKVYLRNIDFVQNESTVDNTVYTTVNVDTILPVITSASIYNNDTSTWENFTAGSIKNVQGDRNHGTTSKILKLNIDEDHILDNGVTVTLVTPNEANPSNPTRTNVEGTLAANGTGKYTWTSDAVSLVNNKTITIEVVVKDKVERENPTSAEYKVLVDTLGPNIEFFNPVNNLEGTSSLTTATTLQAGISDAAGNVAVTKYLISQEEYTTDQAILDAYTDNPSTWHESALGSVSVNTGVPAQTGHTEAISSGKWYFYIYSEDDAGNKSVAWRSFWFDSDYPVLAVSSAPSSAPQTRYNLEDKSSTDTNRNTVTVAGTAYDSNGIKKVEYQLDGGAWQTTDGTCPVWNKTFTYGTTSSDLSQGKHSLKLRATDNADKETVETYSILIDTEVPVITPVNPEGTITRNGNTFKDWLKNPKINASVGVEDPAYTSTLEDSQNISEVTFVYYSIDTNPGTGDWNNYLNYNSTTKQATGAIEFETNGERTVYVKAVDKAGNSSISSFKRYIDTEIDTITAKYSKMGTDGAVNSFGGTTYVNGSTEMTLWGEFADSQSGVAEITLKIDDDNAATNDGLEATITYSTSSLPSAITSSTPLPTNYGALPAEDPAHPDNRTGINSWKAVIEGSQFTKTGKLIVTAKDIAGNEVDAQEILNIDFDTNDPAVNTETISVADTDTDSNTKTTAYRSGTALEYYVNPAKTYTVKGTSSDDKGMASTKLLINGNTYTSSSASAWTFTINDFASYASSASSVTASIVATDVAGNEKTEDIVFKFDNKPPVLSGSLNINGSAYTSGMWSGKTVLTESATLTDSAMTTSDTGSGVAKLYFKRYETQDLATEGAGTSGFISDYRSSKGGIITYGPNGGSVTGLTEGKNYLLFIAEDNVGNAALLSTTPYYVCVDTKSPTVEASGSGFQYSNGSTAVTLSGTCSDADSGSTTDNTITGGSTVQSVTVSVVIGDVTTVPATITKTNAAGEAINPYTWTATIPSPISGITNGGEYDIKVTAKDVAGNESSPLKIATLKGDTDAPTVTLNSIVQSVESGTGTNKKFFVRPDTALTVKGVTDDDISTTVYTWLKLVPYTASGDDNAAVKYIGTNGAVTTEAAVTKEDVRPWTINIPEGTISSTYTGAKLYICTEDLAGNKAVDAGTNLEFDTTGPAYLSASVDSNFVPYTIGGSAYDPAKYHSSENLIVTGSWQDTQAGVSIVYYEAVAPNAPSSTITAANADRTSNPFNSFTVTNKGNGLYTFSTEIRDLPNGTNQIIMYAKDVLGNISTSPLTGTIKVDTVAPEGNEFTDSEVDPAYTYSFTNPYLMNGSENKTLYFWASDADSGIDTTVAPVITLGTATLTGTGSTASYATTETAGSGYKVTVTIDKDDMTSGYKPVVVTIQDKAGNPARINIGSLDIDNTDPEVVLNTPVDADTETAGAQVNGIITISGTATDKNIETRPLTKLEYSTNGTNWTDLVTDFSTSNTNVVNGEVFSVTVDTTDNTKFTDKTTYYVRATASDKAGNNGLSNTITFTVDQDTDRPVITFMDITVPAIAADATDTIATVKLVNTKKLRVTVTDDDGIAENGFTTKVGTTTLTASSSRNGTYVYDLPESVTDGTHDIEFTVVDTATGTTTQRTFKSGTSQAPKLTDGTHKMNKATASVKLMLDSVSPVSSETKYAYYTGNYADVTLAASSWTTSIPALGGTREKLAIKIKAGDENKIASVAAKISTATGEEVSTTTVERLSTTTDTLNNTDGKYYSDWLITDIDLSSTAIPTGGNYKLELTITDCANNTRTDSVQLSIDRTAPVLQIISPKAVSGDNTTYSSGSIKATGSISGASSLRYVVKASGDTNNPPAASEYSEEIAFSTTWNIDFDGNTSAATGVHTELLNTFLVNFGITSQTALDRTNNPYSTITPIYLWLKAVDEVGNTNETPFTILVNPQGDRPTIKISNPQEFEQVFGNTVTIYGTLKDTLGTSADKIGVKSAWVQIVSEAQGDVKVDLNYLDPDPNVNPRAFWRLSHISKAEYSDDQLPTDANGLPISRITAFNMAKVDLDYLAGITDASGNPVYQIYNMKTYKGDGTDVAWVSGSSTIPSGSTANDYAILAKISGASWNLTINSQGEFNPNNLQNPKRNLVGLQVYAKDGDNKINTVTENKYIFIDSDTPLINNLKLEQYDSSNNLIATRTYQADMYISFRNNTTWKLKGTATDDRCITSLKIDGTAQTISETNASENFTCNLTKTGNVGTISFAIEAKDDANHTGTEEISIRFDDQAPALTTSGDSYNIKTIIQQENGFYKFGSVATEDPADDGTSQSGFAYTAFYFMRGNKLYDILKAKANDASTISTNVSAANSGFTYDDSQDPLYWYTKTVTTRDDPVNTLTLASGQSMTGIRKNGLVKIDGTYYRINDVDTTANTFEIDGTPVASATTVYVAAAALIDNEAKEKAKDGKTPDTDGYYAAGDLELDDGDRMVEYVYKSGTSWEWEASVCSKNIADGPVKLVYVVFDQAGNFVSQSADGIICNNTPRIAGFSVYTDYNNNGTVNDEGKDGMYETYLASTYSAKAVTGTTGSGDNVKNVYNPDAKSSVTNQKNPLKNKIVAYKEDPDNENARLPVMTLRGKTKIVPEIVGGNGKVYYDYSIRTTSGSGAKELFTGSTDYTINSKAIYLQLGDLVGIGDVDNTEFKFTFRDSMEDRNELFAENPVYSFTAEQKAEVNAYLSVYMGIAAAASNPPVVKINPFYWNSIKDNSIYGTKNANTTYKDLKGHIELEDDWTNASGYDGTTAGEYDADPKISGQVVVTGTVHDANLIEYIKVNYGSFINNVTVATFDDTNGTLTLTANADKYEAEGTLQGYKFEINKETFSGDGHDVEWTLYLNTEKVGGTTIAATDVALTVIAGNKGTPSCTAVDAANGDAEDIIGIAGNKKYGTPTYSTPKVNTPGSTNTTKTAKTAYYRMDIVPYITDVQTSLSSANKNNHSVYSRTALGHYPVYMTHAQGNTPTAFEQGIKVYGFNLADGSIALGGTSNNTETLAAASGYYTFNLPSGASKGAATVTVGTGANAVSSLNNVNNDDSKGDYTYTGTIPAQGDYTKYTNFYNRMPNKANNNKLTDNVYFDVWDFNTQAVMAYGNGQLDNAVMKVSPTSGMLGFAFSNGSERFSMGGTNVEDGVEYSYLQWNRSFDYMQSTAFAYDSKGHTYGTAAGGDINTQLNWDCLSFMTDRWSQPILGSGTYGNPSVNKDSNVVIQIEGIGQKGDATNPSGGTQSIRKDRFQSISYATMRNKADNGTYIYLAYYDLLNDEIRFKAGELSDTTAASEKYPTNQLYPGKATGGPGSAHADFGLFAKSYNQTTYATNAALCQIVATNTTTGTYAQSNTFGSVGNAVAIGVTSDNIVVMVWADGTDLKYSYNNAFAGYLTDTAQDKTFNNRVKEAARVKASTEGWSGAETLIEGAGEFCQLAVGADNSIHVVAYDGTNSALKYAYLSGYNAAITTAKVCTVDSYLDTGSQLSLDVAAEKINGTTRYVPHIGYWAAYPEKPRYAYLADPDTFFSATDDDGRSGAVSDKFTTVWECGVIPTPSTPKEGKVNVGLWKATVTPTGTTTAIKGYRVASNHTGFSSGTSAAATDKGKCYGNGTDNAVLAYVTTPSSSTYYIETAQMR